ncbi:hypothetical protein [Olivibacter sp. CPCC 100613]|uniref:hypothetical protein n=1 Tax=Olivibacter sp. CPCC 100613 TaxID=3079931 RepID=UPI002FFA1A8A
MNKQGNLTDTILNESIRLLVGNRQKAGEDEKDPLSVGNGIAVNKEEKEILV